jgi:hypothetical protein
MSDAEFAVILDAVVSRTRVEAFRTKTNPSHPDYTPGMREAVVLIHRGEGRPTTPRPPSEPPRAAPTPVALAPPDPISDLAPDQLTAFRAEVELCPYRTKDETCNCRTRLCGLGKGTAGRVTAWDCAKCLGYLDEAGGATAKGLDVASAEPKAYPSLLQQAASAAKAAARFAASGFAIASAEEAERRMAICRTCPEFNAIDVRCYQCGCFLKVKVKDQVETCPVGKW